MKKNILLTGPPGCGKSTLIEKVVRGIKAPVTRFLTSEIREKGKRVGFSIRTFDGKEQILAHVRVGSPFHVGKYGVSIEALEALAIPSLSPGSADVLVVIDEIGKMECISLPFQNAVMKVLDSPVTVLASIAEKGASLIEGIKSREDIVLHKISSVNRDSLAVSITDELMALLGS